MKRCVLAFALAAAVAGGCQRGHSGPLGAQLTAEIQGQLAQREAKLARYRVAGRAEQPGQPPVGFDFTYRAPGFMRGRIFRPQARTVSFDGQSVYEVLPAKKVFRRFTLPERPSERAFHLAELFTPFIPEGYRSPLLPWRSVEATVVSHPRAPEAVALKAQLKDETGKPLTVTYTLRWPSGDFLVKRLEGTGGVAELRVEEERCERRLGVCLPLRLTQWKDGVRVGGTEILELELFEAPPVEDFTLSAPEGYARETAEL